VEGVRPDAMLPRCFRFMQYTTPKRRGQYESYRYLVRYALLSAQKNQNLQVVQKW
jgi:hypothetical protein